MLTGTQLLLSLMVGLSVLAVVAGIRGIVAPGDSADRVQQLLGTTSSGSISLRDLEMRDSFYQGVIQPILSAVLQKLGRLAPQENIEELNRKLETAGLLARLNVIDFLGLKILAGLCFGAMTAGALFFTQSSLFLTGATSAKP